MVIRRATLSDLEQVLPLFEAYRQFYHHPPDVAGARHFLNQRLLLEDSVIFLAGPPERPTGFTQLYPIFSSVTCQPLWLLNDLYVIPGGRRSGVARGLMDRARDYAVETGACGIELATAHTNIDAQRLYESLGYRLDEVFRRYELKI
ncbi:MAG: GNAT family N-acetyltransferase [Gemmatimonadota bacterium]